MISIDEYSMTHVDRWLKIAKKVKCANATIQAFGDKFQCCAVEWEVKYDITQTQLLKQLLGKDGLLLHKFNETIGDVEPWLGWAKMW